jgi:GntR family transcriptional regulator, rspAB operon transcriptional repressor
MRAAMNDATQVRGGGAANLAAMQVPQRPDSLALWVYNTIRQSIIDGTLPAASKVTEASLARELGVSKTPVREALLRLKEVGLVEADGPLAGRIVSPSLEQIRDAYEVREALESKSARLAAERGDKATLLAAEREAERTVVAADRRDNAAYRAADEAFHATIAEAGGNRRLARLIDDTNALVTALRQRDLPGVDASPLCASQHMQIAAALLARDADGAVRLMSEHVRHVASEILTHFAETH